MADKKLIATTVSSREKGIRRREERETTSSQRMISIQGNQATHKRNSRNDNDDETNRMEDVRGSLTRPLSHASSLSLLHITAVVLTLRLGHFVLVSVLLSPWTVRFTCFMIGIFFCPLTSIAELIMESSFFHLDFNLRLLIRFSLSLLDLLQFDIDHGLLDHPRRSFPRRHRFHSGRETFWL